MSWAIFKQDLSQKTYEAESFAKLYRLQKAPSRERKVERESTHKKKKKKKRLTVTGGDCPHNKVAYSNSSQQIIV